MVTVDSQIDLYCSDSLVGSEDAHSSEYTAPCDQRRAYITGFTGSAGAPFRVQIKRSLMRIILSGTAIIQSDRALLFTDGRYFMQASKELDSNWTLMKYGEKGTYTRSPALLFIMTRAPMADVPSWQDYLCKVSHLLRSLSCC